MALPSFQSHLFSVRNFRPGRRENAPLSWGSVGGKGSRGVWKSVLLSPELCAVTVKRTSWEKKIQMAWHVDILWTPFQRLLKMFWEVSSCHLGSSFSWISIALKVCSCYSSWFKCLPSFGLRSSKLRKFVSNSLPSNSGVSADVIPDVFKNQISLWFVVLEPESGCPAVMLHTAGSCFIAVQSLFLRVWGENN